MRILVINPGSTSTKIAIFDDGQELISSTQRYSSQELNRFNALVEQQSFRANEIEKFFEQNNIDLTSIDAVVGRGGLLRPIPSGVYAVNEKMLSDLRSSRYGEHASNLGAILASYFATKISHQKNKEIHAFILDPVIVDELDDIARISGHPLLPRKSIFHALGQKAAAKRFAKKQGKKYEDLNLIVAHMGGGITVGIHHRGRVVDVNNGLDGEGPFSPERAGTLPAGDLLKLAFSGKYSHGELKQMLKGKGGLVAYLNSNDAREIERRIATGDTKAELIYSAMAYQVAKEIGALSTVVNGKIDTIILSGGLAKSDFFTSIIKSRVQFIARVEINTDETEMSALAEGGFEVLQGECPCLHY